VRMKRTAAVLGRCGPVRKQRSFGTVLTVKLQTLASDALAPALDALARAAINSGIERLRDRVAEAGNIDRIGLAKGIAAGLARVRHQMQNGASPAGTLEYFPVDHAPPTG
jgi:hypothetical protein